MKIVSVEMGVATVGPRNGVIGKMCHAHRVIGGSCASVEHYHSVTSFPCQYLSKDSRHYTS